MTRGDRGYGGAVFLFFSNRLGCFGSIVVSIVATILLVLAFNACRAGSA